MSRAAFLESDSEEAVESVLIAAEGHLLDTFLGVVIAKLKKIKSDSNKSTPEAK